jgi:hypothetical protein
VTHESLITRISQPSSANEDNLLPKIAFRRTLLSNRAISGGNMAAVHSYRLGCTALRLMLQTNLYCITVDNLGNTSTVAVCRSGGGLANVDEAAKY